MLAWALTYSIVIKAFHPILIVSVVVCGIKSEDFGIMDGSIPPLIPLRIYFCKKHSDQVFLEIIKFIKGGGVEYNI